MVLTPDGKVSRYFLGIEFSARDLRFGLVEASAGRIGSAIERAVITWCYHYDPTTGKYGLLTMRLVQAGGVADDRGAGRVLAAHVQGRRKKAEGSKAAAVELSPICCSTFPSFRRRPRRGAASVDALYFFFVAVTAFFSLLIAAMIVVFAVRFRRRVAGRGRARRSTARWCSS